MRIYTDTESKTVLLCLHFLLIYLQYTNIHTTNIPKIQTSCRHLYSLLTCNFFSCLWRAVLWHTATFVTSLPPQSCPSLSHVTWHFSLGRFCHKRGGCDPAVKRCVQDGEKKGGEKIENPWNRALSLGVEVRNTSHEEARDDDNRKKVRGEGKEAKAVPQFLMSFVLAVSEHIGVKRLMSRPSGNPFQQKCRDR